MHLKQVQLQTRVKSTVIFLRMRIHSNLQHFLQLAEVLRGLNLGLAMLLEISTLHCPAGLSRYFEKLQAHVGAPFVGGPYPSGLRLAGA